MIKKRQWQVDDRQPYDATVAVTGGTGFVGGAVIRRLTQANLRVRALVRPESVASCFQTMGLSWFHGNLTDNQTLRRLLEGANAVVHCAGAIRGGKEMDFAAANVEGVANIVHAARQTRGCSRILLVSSLAARVPELSAYAESKRRGEDVLRQESGGSLDWTILRPPAVYGPDDRELRPLLQWLRRGILFVPGDKAGRFSLIFVADLAQAILHWIFSDNGGGRCYEIHDGKTNGYCWEDVRRIGETLYRRSVRRIDIHRRLIKNVARLNTVAADMLGYRPMLTPGKVRELCHSDWVCDNTPFSAATGWQPEVDLRQGLRRTLG